MIKYIVNILAVGVMGAISPKPTVLRVMAVI